MWPFSYVNTVQLAKLRVSRWKLKPSLGLALAAATAIKIPATHPQDREPLIFNYQRAEPFSAQRNCRVSEISCSAFSATRRLPSLLDAPSFAATPCPGSSPPFHNRGARRLRVRPRSHRRR